MDRHTEIEKSRDREKHIVSGTDTDRHRHWDIYVNTDGQTYKDRER